MVDSQPRPSPTPSRDVQRTLPRSAWRALCRTVTVALCAALPLLAPREVAAQPRALDWPHFHVTARLDADGTLHVREVQTLRFTGDWNGGERRFDVRLGQRFALARVQRVDAATGDTIALVDGDLDLVDHYALTDGQLLRWRSRLPDDPPFDGTERTYILDYRYGHILQPRDDAFVLDHEFAFRDRTDDIRDFTLRLAIDSAWGVPAGFTGDFRADVLPPGESFLVTLPLTRRSAAPPGDVWMGTPAALRWPLAALLALSLAVIGWRFFRLEAAAQRFAPLVPSSQVDDAWLEANVFSLEPEVAGAAWDDRVGAPEVSATLARMVGEGKLSSRVESTGWKRMPHHVLHLSLRVTRDSLTGYERSLVDGLFGAGATRTDTDAIRKRYAKRGFNPASLIEKSVRSALERAPQSGRVLSPPALWRIPLALAVTGAALLIAAAFVRLADAPIALVSCAIGTGVFLFALLQAHFWRTRVIRPGRHAFRFLMPLAALAGALSWLITSGAFAIGPLALLGLVLVVLAFTTSTLGQARTRYTPERMLFRKRLASAREHFRAELGRAEPHLQDAWYPYLLAFGLGRHVDRWFKAFGGDDVASRHTGAAVGSAVGSSSSGGSNGWSGFSGGGGFAGGGATVAFGAAVGAMSAAVAAPSSGGSSGGGGSSSSGGSSGGGGGGGW